jgi:hypothetical protein
VVVADIERIRVGKPKQIARLADGPALYASAARVLQLLEQRGRAGKIGQRRRTGVLFWGPDVHLRHPRVEGVVVTAAHADSFSGKPGGFDWTE